MAISISVTHVPYAHMLMCKLLSSDTDKLLFLMDMLIIGRLPGGHHGCYRVMQAAPSSLHF